MFRIGDMVKIIDGGYRYTTYTDWVKDNAPFYTHFYQPGEQLVQGDVGKVMKVAPHTREGDEILYLIAKSGRVALLEEKGLKKIELKDHFTKEDLQTGMVVKLRNEDTFLVLIKSIGFIYNYRGDSLLRHKSCGVLPLEDYDDNLRDSIDPDLDVIEVRRLETIEDIFEDYCYDDLEILWQRKKEKITCITGIKFGEEGESTWRAGDIVCNVGDVVLVETKNGRDYVKITSKFDSLVSDKYGRVIRRVHSMLKEEGF